MVRRKKIGQCVYCGEEKELTRDHVIPRSLFTQPVPPLITVPACDACNGSKSRNDDYLRDLLTMDLYGSQHPTAQKLFEGKVLRSHRRNSSHIGRDIISKGRMQPLYTRAGIYLGDYPMCAIDPGRIDTIFTMIVRGLYYDARKQRIPDDYTFTLLRYDPWDFKRIWQKVQQDLHPNGPRILGDVFGCTFVSATEDPFSTWWLLAFYGGACFSVDTMKAARQGS